MKIASLHKQKTGKNNHNWKGGKIKVACSYCGEKKETYLSKCKAYKNTFCNNACRGMWMAKNCVGSGNGKWKPKVEVACSECGSVKKIHQSRFDMYDNFFCGNDCRGKWRSKNLKGKNNPNYNGGSPEIRKIGKRINAGMRKSLKKGKDGYSWEKLLGYTRKQLYIHLDSTMPDGYTWDDIDDLHIDHIVPKSSFNFSDYSDDEFKKCWAIDNLQFLPAVENMQNGCKEAEKQLTILQTYREV